MIIVVVVQRIRYDDTHLKGDEVGSNATLGHFSKHVLCTFHVAFLDPPNIYVGVVASVNM